MPSRIKSSARLSRETEENSSTIAAIQNDQTQTHQKLLDEYLWVKLLLLKQLAGHDLVNQRSQAVVLFAHLGDDRFDLFFVV